MTARRLLPIILLTCSVLPACAVPLAPLSSATAETLPTASVRVTERATTTARPTIPPSPTNVPTPLPTPTARPTPTATPALAAVVLVGAGDIANCDADGAETTARLLDRIEGIVFTLGDHAYPNGTAADFERCYEPTWGRHKGRTRPSPGNHDYLTRGAAAYYAYFRDSAGPGDRGYYSYNAGAWHVVVLDSNIDAGPESAQAEWLRADLTANPALCTLAYWHTAVFSSGAVHGNNAKMKAIWDILDTAGSDVVVAAHEHIYERFAPQTSTGAPDQNGIRQFVVGTGGAGRYAFGDVQPNSEARSNTTYGVLKLTLQAASYAWEFVPVESGGFNDTGSAPCV
jgi:hypothetical protein